MKNEIKAKAKSFLSEYKLNEVTLEDLRRIIKWQGYAIIEFNHIFNDENVTKLIEALGIEDAVDKSRGFTYADKQRRLVFLHEDLSDEEKRLVLAHEEGHIYCGHLSSYPIIGKDVIEEYEANEFTHYILSGGVGRKTLAALKHRKAVSIVAAFLIVSAIGLIVFDVIQKEQRYYGEYYLTSTGSKYHEEQCIFVKNKTNIRRLTIKEFENGEYEPCDICLPHSNVNTEKESGN